MHFLSYFPMGNLISWNGQEEACIGRTPELGYSFANKKILELLMIDTKSLAAWRSTNAF
jgi:hypothetical protein